MRKEGKLENSPAIKRLLTILGYSYETFLDKYQKKTLSYEIDFMRIAKLFINRTKLVTPHIVETEVKELESEIKKLTDAASGVSAQASAKSKISAKGKVKEKDISTSKAIKSMLSIIDYPPEDFFGKYKSKSLMDDTPSSMQKHFRLL